MVKPDMKNFVLIFARATGKYFWWLLSLILLVHVSVIIIFIHNHHRVVELNTSSRHAFERLIIRASQFLQPTDLNQLLKEIDDAGIYMGNYKLQFSLMPKQEFNVMNSIKITDYEMMELGKNEISFYYLLSNGNLLRYTEYPQRNAISLLIKFLLFEIIIISLIILYIWSLVRFTGPLKNFKTSADRFSLDNTEPFEEFGPPAIREAASAINKMQKRILDLINKQTQMLAAISHDLRTPITRLKLRLQFVQDHAQSEGILQDLNEMNEMITEILCFAKNDSASEQKTKFDINALLLSVCYYYIDKGHVIHINADQKSTAFYGRASALKRTFVNLIENSIKYANQLWVSLIKQNDNIIITIKDDGPGIPQSELEKVFQPYYRANCGATFSKEGTGLGLTIALNIVHDHSGSLHLQNLEESGLAATITLPVQCDLNERSSDDYTCIPVLTNY